MCIRDSPSEDLGTHGQGRGALAGTENVRTDTTSDFNKNTGNNEHTTYMFAQNGSNTQRNIWGPDADSQTVLRFGQEPQNGFGGMQGRNIDQNGRTQNTRPQAPNMTGNQRSGKKSGGSKALLIILSAVIGVVVLFAVVFFLVPIGKETLFNKVMYNICLLYTSRCV